MLRVLHFDDDPLDQELIRTHLEEQGLSMAYRSVSRREEYLETVRRMKFDIILSDYGVPGYNGVQALIDTREMGIETPFIIITGTIGEEAAIELMRAGVTDYAFKHRLDRLVSMIQRAIQETQERRDRKQAETELRKNESLLRQMAESIEGVFYLAELDFSKIYYMSPNCSKLWQRDLAGILERPASLLESIHPADRARVERAFQDYMSAPEDAPFELEYRIVRGDGTVRWVHSRRFRVRGDGRSHRFTGLIEDITEHKQLQNHRYFHQRTSEVLARVFDASAAAREIVPLLLDLFGWEAARLWLCTEGGAALASIERWENPSPVDGRALPGSSATIAPAEGPVGFAWASGHLRWATGHELREHLEKTGSPTDFVTGLAVPITGRDSVVGVLELMTRERVMPDAGFENLLLGLGRQLGQTTERSQVELAMREAQTHLRTIMDNAPTVICVKDLQGRILFLNRPGLSALGLEHAQVHLKSFWDLFPSALVEPEEALFRQVVAEGKPSVAELELPVQGSMRTYLTACFPLRDATGNIGAVCGIFTDVTDRKVLESQYRQSQKMEAIGRLAGGIAHDFNNLLTVIIGYTESVLDDLGPGHANSDGLIEVRKAAERAASLTRQLLLFSRREVPRPARFHVTRVVADLERMLRRMIGEDIELVTDLTQPLEMIEADQGQIEQVVMNLVINARDAMPDGGKLFVSARNSRLEPGAGNGKSRTPGPYVVLEVKDTGIGMDASIQQKIFEPFFTTKPPGQGTGLGLATVFGIVEQARGWIELASEPGKGATFSVYLPAAVDAEVAASPEASAAGSETAPPPSAAKHILIVEDESGVRALAKRMLEKAGFVVTAAASPAEAFEVLDSQGAQIHLVLTDVVMPELSGPKMVEKIREKWPDIKVVFMSGYSDERLKNPGMIHASTPVLSKPFSRDSLIQTIQSTLD